MNELEFKKKMKHLFEINTELYKENQVVKKALAYQENENKILKKNIKILENNVKQLSERIDNLLDEMQDIYNNNWNE